MGYKFVPSKKWRNSSLEGFSTAILGLFLIGFQAYMDGFINGLILLAGLLSVILGLYKGFNYMNHHQKDYIRIDGDYISIYRGMILPRKEIDLRDVISFSQVSTVLILHLENGKEVQFNIDWISKESLMDIKEKLNEKIVNDTKIRKHRFNN